jgi:8-hydroxy-5-deazaflavin:NADPH oxidoreductase
MRIGIIGAGQVAQSLGTRLLELGNEVMISSRDLSKPKDKGRWGILPSAAGWKDEHEIKGKKASAGSFRQAAEWGEVLINCTEGTASLQVLRDAGEENLKGKILIDLANPIGRTEGKAHLAFCNTVSLGEMLQAEFKETLVVKTLNTVSAEVMANPRVIRGRHDMLIAGNDYKAKSWVKDVFLRKWLGWKNVIDLGDIRASRSLEMYLMLWLSLWERLQTTNFNIRIVTE